MNLNIQTQNCGVCQIPLTSTVPSTTPYLTVNTTAGKQYAVFKPVSEGPMAVRTTCAQCPVRYLSAQEPVKYLYCCIVCAEGCDIANNIVIPKACFDAGPMEVYIYPPTAGCFILRKYAPSCSYGFGSSWALLNNVVFWTAATALPYGTNVQSTGPNAVGPGGYASWSPDWYSTCAYMTGCRTYTDPVGGRACGEETECAVHINIYNGAGGPNNNITYTAAKGFGFGAKACCGYATICCVKACFCYGPVWGLGPNLSVCCPNLIWAQESGCTLGYMDKLCAATIPTSRASAITNIMPTGNNDVCLCFGRDQWRSGAKGGFINPPACPACVAIANMSRSCTYATWDPTYCIRGCDAGNGWQVCVRLRRKTLCACTGCTYGWCNNVAWPDAPDKGYKTSYTIEICGYRYE